MEYYDWEYMAKELLKCDTGSTQENLKRVRVLITKIFRRPDENQQLIKDIKLWVSTYYNRYGSKHAEAPVIKALIDLKDDEAYSRCLIRLLPILWD